MKQGSVLSPVLYVVFMDHIAKLVTRRAEGVIFGYADDLALIAEMADALQTFVTVWSDELAGKGHESEHWKDGGDGVG